jgi:hypothetical protein
MVDDDDRVDGRVEQGTEFQFRLARDGGVAGTGRRGGVFRPVVEQDWMLRGKKDANRK